MEPEIFTKMLRNLSEKLVAKFHATGLCNPSVKIARLDDAKRFGNQGRVVRSPIKKTQG